MFEQQEIERLKYELTYYEALIDYLCDRIPCLDVVIEDFTFKGEDE